MLLRFAINSLDSWNTLNEIMNRKQINCNNINFLTVCCMIDWLLLAYMNFSFYCQSVWFGWFVASLFSLYTLKHTCITSSNLWNLFHDFNSTWKPNPYEMYIHTNMSQLREQNNQAIYTNLQYDHRKTRPRVIVKVIASIEAYK